MERISPMFVGSNLESDSDSLASDLCSLAPRIVFGMKCNPTNCGLSARGWVKRYPVSRWAAWP